MMTRNRSKCNHIQYACAEGPGDRTASQGGLRSQGDAEVPSTQRRLRGVKGGWLEGPDWSTVLQAPMEGIRLE